MVERSGPHVALVQLRPGAQLPVRMSEHAAGWDLTACLSGDGITLEPSARARVPTGLALAIPPGFEGQVRPRSGWAARTGVTVLNAPGTIDADFRGELEVLLVNLGPDPVRICSGDRIAQLVVAPLAEPSFGWVEALPPSGRGAGGFGSTGGRGSDG
ncbi:MAG: dUTP diphosphatase [Nannocystaceae bacterium]